MTVNDNNIEAKKKYKLDERQKDILNHKKMFIFVYVCLFVVNVLKTFESHWHKVGPHTLQLNLIVCYVNFRQVMSDEECNETINETISY